MKRIFFLPVIDFFLYFDYYFNIFMEEKQPKKIIIFSTAYAPFWGGAEIAVKEITDRIKNADFIMLTSRLKRALPKQEKTGNVLVYRLGFGCSSDKFFLPILAFFKFFQLFWKLKIENCKFILWGLMASYASIAAYLVKLFRPGIPFLLTLQEGDSEDHLKKGKLGLVGFFGKRIIKKADRIQAISSYLREFAIKQGARAEIDIVPNGANAPNLKSRNLNLKSKLNIKSNEKIIITTSRLVKKNAVDVIIEAIELLIASYPLPVTFLILGEGTEKENLKSQISNLKLEDKIIFLGAVPPDKVYDYLAVADVFVRPSRSEGLGSSFLEAMAMGVPVIGTPVGGIPDFLKDGETGLFCRVDDPEDLAEKIRMILEDGALRIKIISNAKKIVEENYNWDKIAEKMSGIFNEL